MDLDTPYTFKLIFLVDKKKTNILDGFIIPDRPNRQL